MAGEPDPQSAERFVTIRDIAERAGVASSTASRILNGIGRASPETRRRILRAADELNYVPSAQARGFRQSRTNTVGVVVPDLDNPLYLTYVRGAQHALEAAGYAVTIADAQASWRRQAEQLRRMLAHRVDGLLVVPPLLAGPELAAFHQVGIPVAPTTAATAEVSVAAHVEGSYPAMVSAIRMLRRLGHERIALVTRRQALIDSDAEPDSFDALVAALSDGELAFEPRAILRADTVEECRVAVQRVGARRKAPTAYLVHPYGLVPRMLTALYDCGLSIPRDISFVAKGDSDWALAHRPPLAVISRDFYRQGALWARQLLAAVDGETVSVPNLPYTFIARESIGPPPD